MYAYMQTYEHVHACTYVHSRTHTLIHILDSFRAYSNFVNSILFRFVKKYQELEVQSSSLNTEDIFSSTVNFFIAQGYIFKTLSEQKLVS